MPASALFCFGNANTCVARRIINTRPISPSLFRHLPTRERPFQREPRALDSKAELQSIRQLRLHYPATETLQRLNVLRSRRHRRLRRRHGDKQPRRCFRVTQGEQARLHTKLCDPHQRQRRQLVGAHQSVWRSRYVIAMRPELIAVTGVWIEGLR